ncbi:subunit of TIM23 translocase complex [Coelomomyces lativittatus]|nr:subunit of TIM23 translocase complex [Coelomomyces lativittatus]
MPPVQVRHAPQQPTIWDKLKMGATMGGLVGLGIGFVFGNVQYLAYGSRGRGYFRSLASAMGTSAASFAFFMAIGTVVRTESKKMTTSTFSPSTMSS